MAAINQTGNINAKLLFEVGDNDTINRLISVYNQKGSGKGEYLRELMIGGFLLKESCLSDLIVAVSKTAEYLNATDIERSKIIVNVLREQFGGNNHYYNSEMITPQATPTPTPQIEPETPVIVTNKEMGSDYTETAHAQEMALPEPQPEPEPEPEPEKPSRFNNATMKTLAGMAS